MPDDEKETEETDPIADLLLSMDAKLDDIGASLQATIDEESNRDEPDSDGSTESEQSGEEGISARAQSDVSGPQTHSGEAAASGGASIENSGLESEFETEPEHERDTSPESGHWYYRKRFGV